MSFFAVGDDLWTMHTMCIVTLFVTLLSSAHIHYPPPPFFFCRLTTLILTVLLGIQKTLPFWPHVPMTVLSVCGNALWNDCIWCVHIAMWLPENSDTGVLRASVVWLC